MPWEIRNLMSGQVIPFTGVGKRLVGSGLNYTIQEITKRTGSQTIGEVKLNCIQRDLKSPPIMAYGDTINIMRPDGVQWFYGIVTSIPKIGSMETESHVFTISDPWWYLTRVVAQQEWPGVTPGLTTRWLFNLSDRADPPLIAAGTHITAGEQIRNLLDDAIAAGVPLSQGQILSADETAGDPEAVKPQIVERLDVTYSEAIRDQLRYVPGAAQWFDYSTSPPTLNIRDISHCDTVTVPWKDFESVELDPQYHLLRDVVVLRYEIVSEVNGSPRLSLSTDKWPLDGNEESLNGYVQTINLRGPSIVVSRANIEVIPVDIFDIDWWIEVNPELTHEDVVAVQFDVGTTQSRTGTLGLPYCLTRGGIADWMLAGAIQGSVEEEICYATVLITREDPITNLLTTQTRVLATKITSTNLITGGYSSTTVTSDGDPQPVGLAKAMYDFWSVLQFAGTATIIERELTGRFRVGQKLRITGGPAEWETMSALIQSVTENVDTGETVLEVGPVSRLSVGDTIDLLR
jgi:hypothetical protein